jgi:20S proteasome subunit alpha 6
VFLQGNDLIVGADEHSLPAEKVDGQNDQDHPHALSDKGSNHPVEAGPNGTATAIDGPDLSTVAQNGTDASPGATTKSNNGATPPQSAGSETLTQSEDPFGSAAAAAAAAAAADELISSVLAPKPATSNEEQSTNGYPETQVSHSLVGVKSLQASASLASTIPDSDAQTQELGSFEEDGEATVINPDLSSQDRPTVGDSEAEAESLGQEHLPEPPASPTSNTLLSISSGSTYGGEPSSQDVSAPAPASPMKTDAKPVKTPSANRLSISYAVVCLRKKIDAGVVEKLKVFRTLGRIEVTIDLERENEHGLKGILVRSFHLLFIM